MKITAEQAVILLKATEGHPERSLEMGYGNGELLETPGNQWAIDLINSARRLSEQRRLVENNTIEDRDGADSAALYAKERKA